MKHLLKTALFASVGAAIAAQTASAQNTYDSGDLLLGFELAGQTHDVVFDLGNIAAFNTGTSSFDLTTDGYSASLVESEFGITSMAGVRWFVAGDDAAGDTIYATQARGSGTVINNALSSSLANTSTKIDSLGNGAGGYSSSTSGNSFLTANATAININNANSVTKLQGTAATGLAVGKLGGTFQTSTLNIAPASGPSISDLYEVQATDLGATPGPAETLGFFTLDSASGDMTFTAPEPSTYSFVACAGGVFFLFRNKFRRQAA